MPSFFLVGENGPREPAILQWISKSDLEGRMYLFYKINCLINLLLKFSGVWLLEHRLEKNSNEII